MIFRKTIIAVLSSATLITVSSTKTVNAAEYNTEHERQMFGQISDNETVIKLPDGGLLHGEMSITHAAGTPFESVENFDSDSDRNAISMKDFRSGVEPKQSGSSVPMLRGTSPSNTLYTVKNNGVYQSKTFSGSGWRFAGYKFVAASGTGQYLLWNAYFDQGRVGTIAQANATKNGSTSGTIVGGTSGKYVAGTTTFYTYNPKYNMYYVVANR